MTAVFWSPDVPARCACAGAYRPTLTRGKLVKSREPAWLMPEQTRDSGCLQEQLRARARAYQLGYQHHTESRKAGMGYPDVHLWSPSRGSVFVELKRMGHDPTAEQTRVMASLLAAGHRVYLARPCCLLAGVVDELMADLAGVPCLYMGRATNSTNPGAAPATGATPARPVPEPPGVVPPTFPDAVGFVVPMSATLSDPEAVQELEAWLRAAGIPPTSVPFPMRIVTGDGVVVVQVRAGLHRPGDEARVWRGGKPSRPFPDHLVERLQADMVAGPSSEHVAWMIAAAQPSRELPQDVT